MTGLSPGSTEDFKRVLGRFASGITVITSIHGRTPVGFACQAFSSLSIDPPLVLFCVSRNSTSWPRIADTGRFAVNVLAADQQHVCQALAARGGDKFRGLDWEPSWHRTAHISGALAVVDCTVTEVHRGGDHLIVVGSVLGLHDRRADDPLVYFGGDYLQATPA